MIHLSGENRARQWLRGLQENDVKFFPNNATTVQAVARGDVQVGLVNHYYLYNLLADNPNLTARNHWFRAGDPGSLVLAAGAGVVSATRRIPRRSALSTSYSRPRRRGSSPAGREPPSIRSSRACRRGRACPRSRS